MESRFNQKMRQFAQLEFLKAKTTPAENGRNDRQPPCAHHRSYPRNFTLCEELYFFLTPTADLQNELNSFGSVTLSEQFRCALEGQAASLQ
jgi:hypothetical protein